MSRTDIIEVDDSPMEIYLAVPERTGPSPAVAVMHHRGGLDEFTRVICDRLAEAGFAAAAPDKYHRSSQDAGWQEARKHITDAGMIADIATTVDYMRRRPEIKTDALAIMGHCMGGRTAYLGASANPAFRATVAYYGGNMFAAFGDEAPSPFQRLSGLQGPVIAFYGNDDRNPSPEDVDTIAAELARLGMAHEFHRYNGAGHAFMNLAGESYCEEASNDSWNKALAFLNRILG